MKLTWLGHSCFKVESDGYTVILDPYGDGSVPGLEPMRERADMVLCSHEHQDHNARSIITLNEGTKSPFQISEIATFHDNKNGELRGKNKITILDDGNYRIAHLGDLGCELENDQLDRLKDLDAVLIPVGGFYTIDAVQAKKLVDQLQPRFSIPMHYHGDAFGYDVLGTLDDFIKLCDDVVIYPSNILEVTRQGKRQTAVLKLIS